VDIADTMDLKLRAARCHASQVADFADFEARLRKRAATLGAAHGYRYAEGFDRVVLPG
jgi:LmbE family N-acetylglucosaminyl deacetylase